MKKFLITIEEIVSDSFEIEAISFEEALKIAEKKYKNGEIILEPGNLISKQISGEEIKN